MTERKYLLDQDRLRITMEIRSLRAKIDGILYSFDRLQKLLERYGVKIPEELALFASTGLGGGRPLEPGEIIEHEIKAALMSYHEGENNDDEE